MQLVSMCNANWCFTSLSGVPFQTMSCGTYSMHVKGLYCLLHPTNAFSPLIFKISKSIHSQLQGSRWQFCCKHFVLPSHPHVPSPQQRGEGKNCISFFSWNHHHFSSPMPMSTLRIYKRRKVSLLEMPENVPKRAQAFSQQQIQQLLPQSSGWQSSFCHLTSHATLAQEFRFCALVLSSGRQDDEDAYVKMLLGHSNTCIGIQQPSEWSKHSWVSVCFFYLHNQQKTLGQWKRCALRISTRHLWS